MEVWPEKMEVAGKYEYGLEVYWVRFWVAGVIAMISVVYNLMLILFLIWFWFWFFCLNVLFSLKIILNIKLNNIERYFCHFTWLRVPHCPKINVKSTQCLFSNIGVLFVTNAKYKVPRCHYHICRNVLVILWWVL